MNDKMTARLNGNLPIAVGVAIVGAVLCALGYGAGPKPFFQGYLFSWVFWAGITIGFYGLMQLHHTVRGVWGFGVLRFFESGGGWQTLVLIALLFLPVLASRGLIYPWADAAQVQADVVLQKKAFYLNSPFFIGRFIAIFGIWGIFAFVQAGLTRRQEQTGNLSLIQTRTNIGAGALVVLVLTVTLGATDWIMSLDAHWYSTVFGIWYLTGGGLGAMALTTFLVMRWSKTSPYDEIANPKVMRDFGNLLLTFTMFWAYLSLSQYLIIWSGNLPEETSYYFRRQNGGTLGAWNVMGAFLLIGQFFAPFLMLLSSRAKRTSTLLIKVAVWILVFRVIDTYWTVTPFFYTVGPGSDIPVQAYLAQAGSFLAIGGLWYSLFVWRLKQVPLLPQHEPRLQEALEHA